MFAYYRSSCHSTAIQRILTGALGDSLSNDVVIVKGHSLEWLTIDRAIETTPSSPLTHQFEQSTFGTVLDARLLHCQFDDFAQADEVQDDANLFEHTSYTRKTRAHSTIKNPDILVLLSEYGKLSFIMLNCAMNRFETLSLVYLDEPGLEYTKIGKKMAIDPCSRAMAVASYQDKFDIFILNEYMSRDRFDPIHGRASIEEVGIIWHMEFLHTEGQSRHRILLALVIYNDTERLCKLVVYSINASDMDNVIVERLGRLPLEKNTPLPLLLVPLHFQKESFLLVTEQQVCLLKADDVACGNVFYMSTTIPRPFGTLESPLFTACATHFDPSVRYVYLGSAQGQMFRLDISQNDEFIWNAMKDVNPISQSMVVIGSIPNKRVKLDVLFYAGESADSQVIAIYSQHKQLDYAVLQTFINRAPLTNYQVMSKFQSEQDSIIACSGQDTHGALSIFNYGIKPTLLFSSDQSWKGLSNIWNLPLSKSESSLLITTSFESTMLWRIQNGDMVDITQDVNIDNSVNTIYVETISVNNTTLLLHVYPEALSIIDLESKESILSWKHEGSPAKIEIATSWVENSMAYIALCLNNGILRIINVLSDSSDPSKSGFWKVENFQSIPLYDSISHVYHFNIGLTSVLMTGSFNSILSFYQLKNGIFHIVQQLNLATLLSVEIAVAYSASLLKVNPNHFIDGINTPTVLLVGLHYGTLLSLTLDEASLDVNSFQLRDQPEIYTLGHQPVKIITSQSMNVIYALSDQLWRIRLDDRLYIESILLPRLKTRIGAIAPFHFDQHVDRESIIVLAENKFMLYELDPSSCINIEKMMIGETPKRVLYDKTMDCAVVVTTNSDDNIRNSSIQLIDMSNGDPLSNSQVVWSDTDYDRSDLILSAAEWPVHHKGKTYKYLCIGIGHPKEPFHSFRSGMSSRVSKTLVDRGTLVLFRLKKHTKKSSFTLKRVWTQEKLPGGVSAICPHPAGLLASAGTRLFLFKLDLVKGELVQVAQKTLRFLITSIDQHEGTICVTLHTDSISLYKFDETTNTIQLLKSDAISRTMHHSILLNERFAVGASQSGGFVGLYDNPKDTSFEQRLETVFSFHYPDIIIHPNLAKMQPAHHLNSSKSHLAKHLICWSAPLGSQSHSLEKMDQRPIVGCTVSGGMVQVYRISSDLYRLLSVLEELLLQFEPTMPLLGTSLDFKEWYCGLSAGEESTIHGDLVELFLKLSRQEQHLLIRNSISDKLLTAIGPFLPENVPLSVNTDDDVENTVTLLREILLEFKI